MISIQQDRKTALQSFFYSRGMDTYKMLHFPRDVKRSDVVGTFLSFISERVVGLTWLWFNLGCLEKKVYTEMSAFSHVSVFR